MTPVDTHTLNIYYTVELCTSGRRRSGKTDLHGDTEAAGRPSLLLLGHTQHLHLHRVWQHNHSKLKYYSDTDTWWHWHIMTLVTLTHSDTDMLPITAVPLTCHNTSDFNIWWHWYMITLVTLTWDNKRNIDMWWHWHAILQLILIYIHIYNATSDTDIGWQLWHWYILLLLTLIWLYYWQWWHSQSDETTDTNSDNTDLW